MEVVAPTKPRKRLSKKQKGFAKDFAQTGNGTQSALKNYDTTDPKTASVMAVENLAKPSVIAEIEKQQITLQAALEKQGVTPERIAEKVDELLESENYKAVNNGLTHATKIYGIDQETPKSPTTQITYNVLINPQVQAKIKEINDSLKEELLK